LNSYIDDNEPKNKEMGESLGKVSNISRKSNNDSIYFLNYYIINLVILRTMMILSFLPLINSKWNFHLWLKTIIKLLIRFLPKLKI